MTTRHSSSPLALAKQRTYMRWWYARRRAEHAADCALMASHGWRWSHELTMFVPINSLWR